MRGKAGKRNPFGKLRAVWAGFRSRFHLQMFIYKAYSFLGRLLNPSHLSAFIPTYLPTYLCICCQALGSFPSVHSCLDSNPLLYPIDYMIPLKLTSRPSLSWYSPMLVAHASRRWKEEVDWGCQRPSFSSTPRSKSPLWWGVEWRSCIVSLVEAFCLFAI